MSETLLSGYDALLSDLDGVVYAGPYAIPGAPEALNRAENTGTPVVFVTNNASRSVESVAAHLRDLGVNTHPERVVSSAQAGAALLAKQLTAGANVLVTGTEALADTVRAAGLTPVTSQADQPVAVVQGFNPNMIWEDLAEASYTLADKTVLWVATNTDLSIPKERGIAPGNGTLVAAVAAATGRTPQVAGKPEAAIFDTAAASVGAKNPVIVGDRLDTDILGAHQAGMPGALVLTGVQTYTDVIAAVPEQRPTYILRTLNDFFEAYPQIEVIYEGYETTAYGPRWQASVQGRTVRMHPPEGFDTPTDPAVFAGSDDEAEAWRVACAAWWAAHPNEGATPVVLGLPDSNQAAQSKSAS